MSELVIPNDENPYLPLELLPKEAVQAIYHAATGKTENLINDLRGNVLINLKDIDRLYAMISDQIAIHTCVLGPTTTVVIKTSKSRSVTYSSWERFKALRVENHDLTSELSLKTEFVIKSPNTGLSQRCIVNVNLDSSLPIVANEAFRDEEAEAAGFFFMPPSEWRTVKTSIDFVDFLVAKSFASLIEEWFKSLPKTPTNRLNNLIRKNINYIRHIISQASRLGMASFLLAYVFFSRAVSITISDAMIATGVSLIIWSVIYIADTWLTSRVVRRVSANIIPSVIIATDLDETTYNKVTGGANSPTYTILQTIFGLILAIALNIAASYIYAYMTSPT